MTRAQNVFDPDPAMADMGEVDLSFPGLTASQSSERFWVTVFAVTIGVVVLCGLVWVGGAV